MKKLLIAVLCLMLACALMPAFAASDADTYLTDRIWELEVDRFANSLYMFFAHNGYGYLADSGAKSSAEMFYFSWYSYDENGTSYIRIDFKEDKTPINGWGNYYMPYRNATYNLLWNPGFMLMLDQSNSSADGSSKLLYIQNAQVPNSYYMERLFAEINAQFQ